MLNFNFSIFGFNDGEIELFSFSGKRTLLNP